MDTQRYITGLTALNIPFEGKQADWHQEGMLQASNHIIHGINYHGAASLFSGTEGLFDCTDFLISKGFNVVNVWCAKPYRVIIDILHHHIVCRHRYPHFFSLEQFLFELTDNEKKIINLKISQLKAMTAESGISDDVDLINQWVINNKKALS